MKSKLYLGFDFARIVAGSALYQVTNDTKGWFHRSLIRMFCTTGGSSNDFFSKLNSIVQPQKDFSKSPKFIKLDRPIEKVSEDLERNGFVVIENAVSAQFCDDILKFGLTQPAKLRPLTLEDQSKPIRKAVYNRQKPEAAIYDFVSDELVQLPNVQSLICDGQIQTIAQNYFKSIPKIDIVNLWWTSCFEKTANKEAAQYFHFDLERFKWLKFFIYITDVDSGSGPHVFIPGTHKAGVIPNELLAKGYQRLTDEEVAVHFPREKWKTFTGKKGTLIIEDTRGLHKGQNATSSDRLILEVQISNSLIGNANHKYRLSEKEVTPDLRGALESFPEVYGKFAVDKFEGLQS